ncbi:MAG: SHOCT domain-containing protein [Eubacterium sp.]|nr:SHOCT domain-containing protein [Eubacterium sp.]
MGLKQSGLEIKKLLSMKMEERVKTREGGVIYCLVNPSGKILDVYDNKVVITSVVTSSSLAFDFLLNTSSSTRGTKTIYYKDAMGVQFKPSGIAAGFIQIETASSLSHGNFLGENSFNFVSSANEDATRVYEYIKTRIDEIKNAPDASMNSLSIADELLKFKQLLDMGAISEEDFERKKRELMR